jgi:hypothetical protein
VVPQNVDQDVGIGEDAGAAGADDDPAARKSIAWHGLQVLSADCKPLGGVFNGHGIHFV